MNTTYTSRLKPQFSNAGVQDVTADFSGAEKGLELLAKENENELKALKNIAQDQAQIEFNRGAAELVDKYGTDFKGLSKAMLGLEQDLYNRIKPTHPEMAEDLLRQYDLVRLRAVDAAHRKYISDNNTKIKVGSAALLDSYRLALPDDYARFLYNISLPAEQREQDIIANWANNLEQIEKIVQRRDMNGNYIYDDRTRKSRANLQDYMTDGAKTLIDRFMSNNDEEGLQKYYEANILAPERYMKETGMDRATYDKVKTYAENGLKKLGVNTTEAKFKQSIAEYEGLQREFFPGKLDELKEQGLPEKLVKSLQTTNVTFSMIDPAKTESPTAMIDSILAVNDFDADYAEGMDAKIETVYNGTKALNEIGKYGQEHGLSDSTVRKAQEMVIKKENQQLFGDIYKNWADMIENFNSKLETARRDTAGFGAVTLWDGMTNAERNKLVQLNTILAESQDLLTRADEVNPEVIPSILYNTQKSVARLKYSDEISPADWAKVDSDSDSVIMLRGTPIKIKGYTENGDIIVDVQK